ncbi:BBE domain-containing protein [Streptomyces sp. BR123]|uniref:BBE domain-containing protein n=1 Tax=Streptomyces sp. BR123 TaxID=2749828 RepID=UPI0028128907|nr:BBE domain-containing protein [Streptomyces sp. BR123]
MQNRDTARWGPNFGRLCEIQAKYDPHHVFRYEQSIPSASRRRRPRRGQTRHL